MKIMSLTKSWKLSEAPLEWNRSDLMRVLARQEGWYTCDLPADVRMPLIAAGVIQDPLVGEACWDSEWIENRSWWFRKEFSADELDLTCDVVELVMDKLDTRSDIFVNDQYVGSHKNVHCPFERNIRDDLHKGMNTITVRVTSGLEEISNELVSELSYATCLESRNGGVGRGDFRRAFVRRPQYTVGWDWGPKIITVGMAGDVFLRSYKSVAVREAKLVTVSIGETARLAATVNVENLSIVGTTAADIRIELLRDGKRCAFAEQKDVLLTSGYNYLDMAIEVPAPALWWPAGYGDQPLYDVKVTAVCGDVTTSFPAFRFGIRTLVLDTHTLEGDDRSFQLIVNGLPIYCKGGNWVPSDMIHARVTKEKIAKLIEEAVEANFNMMRVWGGGLYEQDAFYELCDEHGLLIWHDFMMACSTYPDHLQWFRDEMYSELDYQTKRLRSHPSLALFCGTNEVHWIFNNIDNPRWSIEFKHEKPYGLYLSNCMAKEIIYKNCAHVPYWNSSPYGGNLPNADTVGDVHRWHNALMSLDMRQRIEPMDFDTVKSKFVSEYGYIGPCNMASTKEYLGGADMDRGSAAWALHRNVFERGTVCAGIEKSYAVDAASLPNEDYILYGGMVHSLMLDYSLEALRFQERCFGGLFWMYNDAWGEEGWTIVDYYQRRKIPYYGVKRALAHTKLTLRQVDGEVVVQGMNDTPAPVQFDAEFGYVSFDGKTRKTRKVSIALEPHSRTYLLRETMPQEDFVRGTVMLLPADASIAPVWLRVGDMRALVFEKTAVEIVKIEACGADTMVTVTAPAFAHGVHITGDLDCSDNYFDLLPGQVKTVRVKNPGNTAITVASVR